MRAIIEEKMQPADVQHWSVFLRNNKGLLYFAILFERRPFSPSFRTSAPKTWGSHLYKAQNQISQQRERERENSFISGPFERFQFIFLSGMATCREREKEKVDQADAPHKLEPEEDSLRGNGIKKFWASVDYFSLDRLGTHPGSIILTSFTVPLEPFSQLGHSFIYFSLNSWKKEYSLQWRISLVIFVSAESVNNQVVPLKRKTAAVSFHHGIRARRLSFLAHGQKAVAKREEELHAISRSGVYEMFVQKNDRLNEKEKKIEKETRTAPVAPKERIKRGPIVSISILMLPLIGKDKHIHCNIRRPQHLVDPDGKNRQ